MLGTYSVDWASLLAVVETQSDACRSFSCAQLRHWGLPYEGYSGSTQEVRRDIVNAFARRLSVPTPHRYQMLESPDALDAVLAAFAAVAVCRNRIAVPPPDNTEEEGWIAIHE
jgi:Protein of unknown function (DUF429)